jgi:hypothetical protein
VSDPCGLRWSHDSALWFQSHAASITQRRRPLAKSNEDRYVAARWESTKSTRGVEYESPSLEPISLINDCCRFASRRCRVFRTDPELCSTKRGASVHARRHAALPGIRARPCSNRGLPPEKQSTSQSCLPHGDVDEEEAETRDALNA